MMRMTMIMMMMMILIIMKAAKRCIYIFKIVKMSNASGGWLEKGKEVVGGAVCRL